MKFNSTIWYIYSKKPPIPIIKLKYHETRKLPYSWLDIIINKYSNKNYEWISKTSDSTIKHIYKIYIHIMISRTLKLLLYKTLICKLWIFIATSCWKIIDRMQNPKRGPTPHLHMCVRPGGIRNGYIGRFMFSENLWL